MLRVLIVTAALAACGNDSVSTAPPQVPPPPSDNPIDVAIWPRLVAAGTTTLTPASPQELCRRMALDLIGVAPSTDEIAANCTGKTPEQMARAFLASPRFRDIERRFWIRRIGADPTTLMADHLADADRLFYALADGTLGYDDFAAQLLAHPIMTIDRPVAAGN